MMPVMPVLTNGGTYITVRARDVVNMAHNAIAEIENNRAVAVREAHDSVVDRGRDVPEHLMVRREVG